MFKSELKSDSIRKAVGYSVLRTFVNKSLLDQLCKLKLSSAEIVQFDHTIQDSFLHQVSEYLNKGSNLKNASILKLIGCICLLLGDKESEIDSILTNLNFGAQEKAFCKNNVKLLLELRNHVEKWQSKQKQNSLILIDIYKQLLCYFCNQSLKGMQEVVDAIMKQQASDMVVLHLSFVQADWCRYIENFISYLNNNGAEVFCSSTINKEKTHTLVETLCKIASLSNFIVHSNFKESIQNINNYYVSAVEQDLSVKQNRNSANKQDLLVTDTNALQTKRFNLDQTNENLVGTQELSAVDINSLQTIQLTPELSQGNSVDMQEKLSTVDANSLQAIQFPRNQPQESAIDLQALSTIDRNLLQAIQFNQAQTVDDFLQDQKTLHFIVFLHPKDIDLLLSKKIYNKHRSLPEAFSTSAQTMLFIALIKVHTHFAARIEQRNSPGTVLGAHIHDWWNLFYHLRSDAYDKCKLPNRGHWATPQVNNYFTRINNLISLCTNLYSQSLLSEVLAKWPLDLYQQFLCLRMKHVNSNKEKKFIDQMLSEKEPICADIFSTKIISMVTDETAQKLIQILKENFSDRGLNSFTSTLLPKVLKFLTNLENGKNTLLNTLYVDYAIKEFKALLTNSKQISQSKETLATIDNFINIFSHPLARAVRESFIDFVKCEENWQSLLADKSSNWTVWHALFYHADIETIKAVFTNVRCADFKKMLRHSLHKKNIPTSPFSLIHKRVECITHVENVEKEAETVATLLFYCAHMIVSNGFGDEIEMDGFQGDSGLMDWYIFIWRLSNINKDNNIMRQLYLHNYIIDLVGKAYDFVDLRSLAEYADDTFAQNMFAGSTPIMFTLHKDMIVDLFIVGQHFPKAILQARGNYCNYIDRRRKHNNIYLSKAEDVVLSKVKQVFTDGQQCPLYGSYIFRRRAILAVAYCLSINKTINFFDAFDLKHTASGRNILHYVCRREMEMDNIGYNLNDDFIRRGIEKKLCEADILGETPIHLLVRRKGEFNYNPRLMYYSIGLQLLACMSPASIVNVITEQHSNKPPLLAQLTAPEEILFFKLVQMYQYFHEKVQIFSKRPEKDALHTVSQDWQTLLQNIVDIIVQHQDRQAQLGALQNLQRTMASQTVLYIPRNDEYYKLRSEIFMSAMDVASAKKRWPLCDTLQAFRKYLEDFFLHTINRRKHRAYSADTQKYFGYEILENLDKAKEASVKECYLRIMCEDDANIGQTDQQYTHKLTYKNTDNGTIWKLYRCKENVCAEEIDIDQIDGFIELIAEKRFFSFNIMELERKITLFEGSTPVKDKVPKRSPDEKTGQDEKVMKKKPIIQSDSFSEEDIQNAFYILQAELDQQYYVQRYEKICEHIQQLGDTNKFALTAKLAANNYRDDENSFVQVTDIINETCDIARTYDQIDNIVDCGKFSKERQVLMCNLNNLCNKYGFWQTVEIIKSHLSSILSNQDFLQQHVKRKSKNFMALLKHAFYFLSVEGLEGFYSNLTHEDFIQITDHMDTSDDRAVLFDCLVERRDRVKRQRHNTADKTFCVRKRCWKEVDCLRLMLMVHADFVSRPTININEIRHWWHLRRSLDVSDSTQYIAVRYRYAQSMKWDIFSNTYIARFIKTVNNIADYYVPWKQACESYIRIITTRLQQEVTSEREKSFIQTMLSRQRPYQEHVKTPALKLCFLLTYSNSIDEFAKYLGSDFVNESTGLNKQEITEALLTSGKYIANQPLVYAAKRGLDYLAVLLESISLEDACKILKKHNQFGDLLRLCMSTQSKDKIVSSENNVIPDLFKNPVMLPLFAAVSPAMFNKEIMKPNQEGTTIRLELVNPIDRLFVHMLQMHHVLLTELKQSPGLSFFHSSNDWIAIFSARSKNKFAITITEQVVEQTDFDPQKHLSREYQSLRDTIFDDYQGLSSEEQQAFLHIFMRYCNTRMQHGNDNIEKTLLEALYIDQPKESAEKITKLISQAETAKQKQKKSVDAFVKQAAKRVHQEMQKTSKQTQKNDQESDSESDSEENKTFDDTMFSL